MMMYIISWEQKERDFQAFKNEGYGSKDLDYAKCIMSDGRKILSHDNDIKKGVGENMLMSF